MANELQNQPTGTATPTQGERKFWRKPRYEIWEGDDSFFVDVYVPGVRKDAVDINREGGQLVITAERTPRAQEGWKPLSREIPQADYRLVLEVNVPVNEENISARLENGVLRVDLPKAEEFKPRKIKVS